jgi:hypothetical protein
MRMKESGSLNCRTTLLLVSLSGGNNKIRVGVTVTRRIRIVCAGSASLFDLWMNLAFSTIELKGFHITDTPHTTHF